MSVKIRLQRHGRKASPFYHIVIANSRSPRDGRFIEKIGTYNPLTIPATIELNRDKAYEWLKNGAQPTDTVLAILRFKGVMLRKHLERGVSKGSMTQEEAESKLVTWIEEKEGRVAKRREVTADAKAKFVKAVDGVAKVKVKPVVIEEVPVVEEEAEAAAEEVVAAVAAPIEAVVEAAAPVEAAVEAVVEAVEAPVEAVVEVAEAPVEAAAEVVEAVAEVTEAPAEEAAAPAADETTEA